MKKRIYIGIDVSNATLDVCVREGQKQQSFVINNTTKDIRKFFKKYYQGVVIGMENTGRYNWFLYEALAATNHKVFVVSPLHIKKSLGLVRGKTDKIDAVRIASFIEKNESELKEWQSPSKSIQKLKILLTERSARVKNKTQLQRQQHDYVKMKSLGLDSSLLKMNQQLIAQLNQQIKTIEGRIEQIIKDDNSLKQQAILIQSVPGVGKVLCWMMLTKTENFTLIDTPRKMACYSGVAPFAHQSGTSIRGKNRVSVYADKSIKSVLHLAAMSAIRKSDLQQYYERKVAEGKNKMSILNAVRNKIIHRIFAVVKSQQPYQNFNLVVS